MNFYVKVFRDNLRKQGKTIKELAKEKGIAERTMYGNLKKGPAAGLVTIRKMADKLGMTKEEYLEMFKESGKDEI